MQDSIFESMELTRSEGLWDLKETKEGCHSRDYSAHFCPAQGDKFLHSSYSRSSLANWLETPTIKNQDLSRSQEQQKQSQDEN
jgi:hypothetical protein